MTASESYARIVRSFWTDPEIRRALGRDLKELLLYFFSSPHGNMVGLYYLPLDVAAREADHTVEEIRGALAGPLAAFVTYDEETEEVFVHAAAKHQVGEELVARGKNGRPDRRIEGVRRLVEACHSAPLRRLFLQRYGKLYHLGMRVPDPKVPSKGSRHPIRGASKGLSSPIEGASKGHRSPKEAITDTEAETETVQNGVGLNSPTPESRRARVPAGSAPAGAPPAEDPGEAQARAQRREELKREIEQVAGAGVRP